MRFYLTYLLFFCSSICIGQNSFTSDPEKAEFITSDIDLFWQLYDQMEITKNPFKEYLSRGSKGVKDFIPYRIENAKHLLKTVKSRKSDYNSSREGSLKVAEYTEKMRGYYKELKGLYPDAVFPPAYFVIGAYNSGGTSTSNGLIMGVEMQQDIAQLPYIVAHELIHFNQNYGADSNTLLSQSIMEGAADFMGELISGKHINKTAMDYFNANEDALCKEFAEIMNNKKYHGWLYGGNGKNPGRPNDLGYSIGYKICMAYYDKHNNPQQAIRDILNIQDFEVFLRKSGYLAEHRSK